MTTWDLVSENRLLTADAIRASQPKVSMFFTNQLRSGLAPGWSVRASIKGRSQE